MGRIRLFKIYFVCFICVILTCDQTLARPSLYTRGEGPETFLYRTPGVIFPSFFLGGGGERG